MKFVSLLHISKTGGTSLKTVLKSHPKTDRYMIFLRGHTCTLKDIPKGDKVIFFLRDPITRFVSGFYQAKRKEEKLQFPWSSLEEQIAFTQFNTVNEFALALGSEDEKIRDIAIKCMKYVTHVNTSFWDWFETEEYFLSRMDDILYVGFQETLSQDFINIKKILGLPSDLELPKNDKQTNKMPSKYDTHLDERGKQYLKLWYHREYDFIEMVKTIWEDDKQNGMIPRSKIYVQTSKDRIVISPKNKIRTK